MKRLVLKFYQNAEENGRWCCYGWLLMQKYLKGKECRGFVYKKHTSAAAYMIQLTFANVLYSLYIVCMHKKIYKCHLSQPVVQVLYGLYIFCMYKNIQRPFQLASCIDFVQFVHCLYVQKIIHFKFKAAFNLNLAQVLYGLYIFCLYVGV